MIRFNNDYSEMMLKNGEYMVGSDLFIQESDEYPKVTSILLDNFDSVKDPEVYDIFEIIAFHIVVLSSNEYKPVTIVPDNYTELLKKCLASFDTGIVDIVERSVDLSLRKELDDYFTADPKDRSEEDYLHLNRSVVDDYDLYGYLEYDLHSAEYATNTDIIFCNDYREHTLRLIKRTYRSDEYDYSELLFRHIPYHNAPIEEESTGTVKIIHLLTLFISQLAGRKDTLVIDELECSIHASIMKECVRLFTAEEISGSQLIATTHETSIMDLDCLNKDSFWFVDSEETGQDCHSRLYALRTFTGNIKDYRTMYLDGRFDAIPSFLTVDLKGE